MFHSMFRISVLPVLAMSRRHVKSTAWRLLEISPFPAKLQGSVLARWDELIETLHTLKLWQAHSPELMLTPKPINALNPRL